MHLDIAGNRHDVGMLLKPPKQLDGHLGRERVGDGEVGAHRRSARLQHAQQAALLGTGRNRHDHPSHLLVSPLCETGADQSVRVCGVSLR